ncbi:hypothetical protein GCM10025789_06200 [Tessaracoccus lubricantis]|uniref:Uncharacterized protein n=1 Tax=Tessaracoccus lubricantis TaxID=545543 RepID=A0ABP9F3E4_9ACTN
MTPRSGTKSPDGDGGWEWVAAEARLKAGIPEAGGTVLGLDPPLPGYMAALAVAVDGGSAVVTRVAVGTRGEFTARGARRRR